MSETSARMIGASPQTGSRVAGAGVEPVSASRWFSANPDKAWVEKFFLAYSPVWMASMAYMMLSGADKRWSDVALLIHAFATALPVLLVPMLLARRYTDRPWFDSY